MTEREQAILQLFCSPFQGILSVMEMYRDQQLHATAQAFAAVTYVTGDLHAEENSMRCTVQNLPPPSSAVKICTYALIAVILGVWTSNITALDNESAEGSKVLALEKEWNEVYKRSDVARMDELLADDYIITIEDGSTFSKPGYIAHNGNSSVHVEISEMSDLKVRMHGNTAVVTGAYHEKGIEAGKPYEYHDRLTDVWMKSQNRWKLIASHYSLRGQ